MSNISRERVYGCFFGQLVGDALGSRYEFGNSKDTIIKIYRDIDNNFLEIKGGGPFKVGKGQVTDDSELFLGITRSILKNKKYSKQDVAKKYISWFRSNPPDIGVSTKKAFMMANNYDDIVKNSKRYNINSLSNGCLMRISILGIYGNKISDRKLEKYIEEDCLMTNPNKITIDATTVFVFALREAIKTGNKNKIFQIALNKARTSTVKDLLESSKSRPYPVNIEGNMFYPDSQYQGYFGFAFQNAFYHLLNGKNFYLSMIDTISMGGDTDTNGCIIGSLLGAYYGVQYIPEKWIGAIINSKVKHNRLEKYPDVNTKDSFKIIENFI